MPKTFPIAQAQDLYERLAGKKQRGPNPMLHDVAMLLDYANDQFDPAGDEAEDADPVLKATFAKEAAETDEPNTACYYLKRAIDHARNKKAAALKAFPWKDLVKSLLMEIVSQLPSILSSL